MNRRTFLTTTAAGAAVFGFPAILRAQSKDVIKIGFPLPLTGPFGALAVDQQRGATLAMEELNAKNGILGRKVEVLFRDDQLKPAIGAQRTKELIENEHVQFVVGGLAAHVQAAKPEAIYSVTPGADNIAFLKQYASFGMKKTTPVVQPLLWLPQLKEGGAEVYADIYGGTNFYWELADTVPQAKRYNDAHQKRFGMPAGDYGAYAYSGVMEVARGIELTKSTEPKVVADALRASREYDHYKGKQWWRACDGKSFQDMWILKGRQPGKTRGEWGIVEVVARIPANEELDRSCAEKGLA